MEIPLSLTFVFWNKNSQDPEHKITCMVRHDNTIATGSSTGELVLWKLNNSSYSPSIICSPGNKSVCFSLTLVSGPMPEVVGSKVLVASLHSDRKIRLWDLQDGRCTSTSSSSLLPNYEFNHILGFDKQFLALYGECSDIIIVDAWSMEQVSFLSMSGTVIKVLQGTNELWAVDNNESLRIFNTPPSSPYYYNLKCQPHLPNTPKIIYNIREEIQNIELVHNQNIVIVQVKGGIRIFLRQWIEDGLKEYYHIDKKGIISIFCEEDISIITNHSIYSIDSKSIEKNFQYRKENVLSRSNSLTNIKVHSLNQMMKEQKFELNSVTLTEFSKDFKCGYKDNTIFTYHSADLSVKKSVFSFKSIGFSCFADMNLHYILAAEETITCSLVYLTAEWPIYIIGTSQGKIYLSHFKPFQTTHLFNFHTFPITCIYVKGEKLISCCKSHLMCIWDLKLTSIENNEPENVFSKDRNKRWSLPCLTNQSTGSKEMQSNKPVQTIEFYFGSIQKILRVDGIREDLPLESTDLIIGQSKDFSVILVSLSIGQLIGQFPPISGDVQEAYFCSSIGYIYLISDKNDLFVLNIDSKVQERIVNGNDVAAILRKPIRTRIKTETFDEVVEDTSEKHKVLMYNLRQFFPTTSQSALKISTHFIGNLQVSVLNINVQLILKKLKKLNGPSKQLEYIISLLTCWVPGCKAHDSILNSVKDILLLNLPAIKANIGIVGVDNTVSFTLPGSSSFFEISSYVSAIVMSAGYALIEGIYQLIPSGSMAYSRIATGHLLSNVHISSNFQLPFLPVLAIQSFFGIFTSRFILQDNVVFITRKSKQDFLLALSELLQDITPSNIESHHISLIQALSTTLLGYSIIELKSQKPEMTSLILSTLKSMLKSENEGYYITAACILGKGMEQWKSELKSDQVKEIVEELILYGCKESQKHKQVFYKALISIASCDFIDFIEILAQEIENMDIDPLYPSSCIRVLDMFIEKKYDKMAAYLPAVIELIVRTLNPHNPMLRKTTIEKAGHTLKTLIMKLPMITFSQKTQRLAIGTMDNLVVVYDLKTASQWKILKGHTGPVCAVEFDKNGDFLASFSSVDCTVRVWKIKSGFFQDLIGSSTSKALKVFEVECLDAQNVSYKKFLDVVRLAWTGDDKIFLTREDGSRVIVKE